MSNNACGFFTTSALFVIRYIEMQLFCRLQLHFNEAFKSKISFPEMSWNGIAYENGYYDMHLIKEFKQFANASPAVLFHENPDSRDVGFETLELTSS